jgi:hypothetical protein
MKSKKPSLVFTTVHPTPEQNIPLLHAKPLPGSFNTIGAHAPAVQPPNANQMIILIEPYYQKMVASGELSPAELAAR